MPVYEYECEVGHCFEVIQKFFFFQAEDGIRYKLVTGVQTCALPISRAVAEMRDGDVVLLENLRFHPEEEANDEQFARALASLADVYVNDAFGTAHRAHASTVGITRFLPAVAGLLMEKELVYLSPILEGPRRPFVAILGGKKVSDKIGGIRNLLTRADMLLIGGAMSYTFLRAKG